jgi:hypothetical protein
MANYVVKYHKEGKTTKKAMGEKRPALLLGYTEEEARAWKSKAESVSGNKEERLYCELFLETGQGLERLD